jgi:hypothetical protein
MHQIQTFFFQVNDPILKTRITKDKEEKYTSSSNKLCPTKFKMFFTHKQKPLTLLHKQILVTTLSFLRKITSTLIKFFCLTKKNPLGNAHSYSRFKKCTTFIT